MHSPTPLNPKPLWARGGGGGGGGACRGLQLTKSQSLNARLLYCYVGQIQESLLVEGLVFDLT